MKYVETLKINKILNEFKESESEIKFSIKQNLVIDAVFTLLLAASEIYLLYYFLMNVIDTYLAYKVYCILVLTMIIMNIPEVYNRALKIKDEYTQYKMSDNSGVDNLAEEIEDKTYTHYIDAMIGKIVSVNSKENKLEIAITSAGKALSSISTIHDRVLYLENIHANGFKIEDEIYILMKDGKASSVRIFNKSKYSFDIDDKKLVKSRYKV